MNFDKFTEKSMKAIQMSQDLASENNNSQIDDLHILYSLITLEDSLIYEILKKLGKKLYI